MKKREWIQFILFIISGLFVSYFLILHVVHGSVFAKCITLLFSILGLITFMIYNKTKDNTNDQIMILIFFLYVFQLCSVLFFEHGFGRHGMSYLYAPRNIYKAYFQNSCNFIPFRMILFYMTAFLKQTMSIKYLFLNVVGNFISFMPFALFIPLFFPKFLKTKNYMIFIAITILSVEIFQMVLLTGSCDIDDFILNVSGSLCAYFLLKKYHVWTKIRKELHLNEKKKK